MTTTTENQPTHAQWDAANRFLNQLLIDPTLANNYQQIIQQANGQDNAPEILTTWLQEQGYDTTPDLVYAALINLQNTSLGYWTGVYGQSFFEDNQPAPVLMIAPNAEGNATPYLDGVELKNYVFQSVKVDDIFHPTLSWNLDSNNTIGNITFYYKSGITLDSNSSISYDLTSDYVGNWFKGTLQTSSGASPRQYYGAIDSQEDSSNSLEGNNSAVVFPIVIVISGAYFWAINLDEAPDEAPDDRRKEQHAEFTCAQVDYLNFTRNEDNHRPIKDSYFYGETISHAPLENSVINSVESFLEKEQTIPDARFKPQNFQSQAHNQPEKPSISNKIEQPKQPNNLGEGGVLSNNFQGQQLHDKPINNVDPKSNKEPESKPGDLEIK